MPTYTFYIEDNRMRVPTLLFETAKDEAAARRLARVRLAESRHQMGVEVWEGDRFLFRLVPRSGGRDEDERISG